MNDIYNSRLKKEGIESSEKVGTVLFADPKYLDRALMLLTEFGTMLIQVAWRKICPNECGAADRELGHFAYELLERDHLPIAERVLVFAKSLRGKRDPWQRLANTINLANCYRLQGQAGKSEKELEAEDWEVLGNEFRLSVSAIRGEVEKVVQLMEALVASKADFPAENYELWPVFFGVREKMEFRDAFSRVFYREFVPAPTVRNVISKLVKFGNPATSPPSDDESEQGERAAS